MWGAHEGMGWWMLFGGLWMVLFWGIILGGVIWAVSRLAGGRDAGRSPLDIAKERYARGEISAEEFERIRHDLSAS